MSDSPSPDDPLPPTGGAPPDEEALLAARLGRARALAAEEGAALRAVRRCPPTDRWWVTLGTPEGLRVLAWEGEGEAEEIAGSPFADADAAFVAVEALVLPAPADPDA